MEWQDSKSDLDNNLNIRFPEFGMNRNKGFERVGNSELVALSNSESSVINHASTADLTLYQGTR